MSQVYGYVTERILLAMETNGSAPWRKPWTGTQLAPCSYNGRRYNGANFFFMAMLPFQRPIYLTYKRIVALGGKLKDSERKRHVPVYYWKILKKETTNAITGKKEIVTTPWLAYHLVWNIEQCDGVPLPKFAVNAEAKAAATEFNPVEAADAIVAGYANGPTMAHGGNRACYSPTADSVTVPQREAFTGRDEYYSTLFHELAHSTGHGSRLNRKGITDPISFGSHAYSHEEMIAELTAAYLCAESGIDNSAVLENSAAYIASWSAKLKSDPKLFMLAASAAHKAATRILGDAREYVPGSEGETAEADAEAG